MMSESPDQSVAAGESIAQGPSTPSRVSRAAVNGAAWMGLASWVNQAVSLGTFIVLGRLLAPDDFGLVAAASVVIWILRVVVDQGFSQVLIQRADLAASHVDTAFWTAFGTGIFIAAITAATAPLVAELYSLPGLTNILRVLSLVFVFASLDATQSALLTREMKFRVQAIRRLMASAISAVVAIALATSGAGAWALVAQTLAYESLLVIFLWSLVSWRPKSHFSMSDFRDLFGFGMRLTLIRILTNIGANADNLLIGIVVGSVALGYYVVGFRVVTVLNALIAVALVPVVLSAFSRLQHDLPALNAAFYRSTKLATAISLPIYAGLALVAHPLTVLVFGEKWVPSVGVIQALALAGFVQCQLIFSTQYVIALGKVSNELRWTGGLIGAELIAFGVAVQFGIVAVALSLGIVLLIAWPIRLLRLRAWGGIHLQSYFQQYPSFAAATLAMTGAVVGVGAIMGNKHEALSLLIKVTAGALVYVAALAVFARREVQLLRVWMVQFVRGTLSYDTL